MKTLILRPLIILCLFAAALSVASDIAIFRLIEQQDLIGLVEYYKRNSTADLSVHDELGRSPLMVAIESGNESIVSYLLQNGSDPNYISTVKGNIYYGLTPLMIAISVSNTCNQEIVNSLLRNKADIDAVSIRGSFSALMLSLSILNTECANLLFDAGAETKLSSTLGMTALHYAMFTNNDQIIQKLILSSESIDLQDKQGTTPLMIAAAGGNINAIKMLLNRGACMNALNTRGMTALDFAIKFDHKEIIKVLESGHQNCRA